MTVIERTAEVIGKCITDPKLMQQHGFRPERHIAQTLADAGLLIEEHPEIREWLEAAVQHAAAVRDVIEAAKVWRDTFWTSAGDPSAIDVLEAAVDALLEAEAQ